MGEATIKRALLYRHIAIICIVSAIGAWLPLQFAKIAFPPKYDSAQYITMAYNMAKYNISSVSADDSPQVKPDLFREPAPSFILSLPMRLADLDRYPLSCLLGEGAHCDDLMKMERGVNVIVAVLVIPGVYLAAYWLTMSYWWAIAAATAVATNSVLPSFVPVYSSELFGAMFLLWHSLLFFGAVSGRARVTCAIGSGIFLAALILSKAIYLYYIPCLIFIAIIAFILPRRFDARSIAVTLMLILLPAITGVGSWMTRNYAVSGQFVVSGRAEPVLAIHAGYTKISWKQYFSGYAYFTPYVGPSIARYFFGDLADKTYDDNSPDGVRRHILAGTPTSTHTTGAAQQREILRIILTNWDKQLALVPLLSYRGMFVGGCCTTLGNTVPKHGYDAWRDGWLLMSLQIVMTAVLGPGMLWLCYLLARKRMWSSFAFVGIVLFHFLIHASATQFYSRFSVPVFPNLAVMLFVLLWVLSARVTDARSVIGGRPSADASFGGRS